MNLREALQMASVDGAEAAQAKIERLERILTEALEDWEYNKLPGIGRSLPGWVQSARKILNRPKRRRS